MEDLLYLNVLKRVNGLGPAKISRLVEYFRSPKGVWEAGEWELSQVLTDKRVLDELLFMQKNLKPEAEWEKLEKYGVRATMPGMPDYPDNLAQIYDPPTILYYRGNLSGLNLALAMVGSRKSTPYGRAMARSIAKDLVKGGFVVVSGLARGIDSEAHRGALDGGGRTIAVLGSGLDIVYPRENKPLYEEIINSGAVISEFCLGVPPVPGNFPARNRIISGLCLGTLVIEGKEKSGSLITAEFALEQGRDVFALPGPANAESSRGPHKLIKQGAKLVEAAGDIFEEYPHLVSAPQQMSLLDPEVSEPHQGVLKLLSYEPLHIDTICGMLKTTPEKLAGLLVELELSGYVQQLSGGYYVKFQ